MKSRIRKNREQKHPLSRIPPEKKKELNYLLHDKEVVSVFTDCSSIPETTTVGLGASFIGYSDIIVRSKKLPTDMLTPTMYGELKAITFAIETLPKILERYQRMLIKPRKVIIYSDCEHIKKSHEILLSSNVAMKEAMEEMVIAKNTFNQLNSSYHLEVNYLSADKKHHLYHRMAHSAAKKILLK